MFLSLLLGVLKFNMDGALRGKLGPTGIRGVLHNSKGDIIIMFFEHVRVCGSNEAEVLPILESPQLSLKKINELLIVESNSSNVITGRCSLGGFNFFLMK